MKQARYKVIQAVQDNGPNFFLIFEGVKVFGAIPIARCETQEQADALVAKLNDRPEQNEVDYIGCRIAQRLTSALAGRVSIPHADLEKLIYEEFTRVGKEHRTGDWIELPNGTCYTLTYKPVQEYTPKPKERKAS